MIETRRFWLQWLAWTAGLAALAFLAGAVGGGVDGAAGIRWIASAMVLAAYPAGLWGRDLLRWEDPPLRSLGRLAVATGVVAGLVFLVRAWLGPALAGMDPATPSTWPLGVRAAAWETAVATAREAGTLETWTTANTLGWEVQLPVTNALTCLGFAWIGVLVGRWLEPLFRREVRIAVYAAAGLLLLVTGYLMTENGYELILLRTVGPAEVAAWFPIISPGMLTVGLLVPTVVRLLAGGGGGRPPGRIESAGPAGG